MYCHVGEGDDGVATGFSDAAGWGGAFDASDFSGLSLQAAKARWANRAMAEGVRAPTRRA